MKTTVSRFCYLNAIFNSKEPEVPGKMAVSIFGALNIQDDAGKFCYTRKKIRL